MRFARTGFLRFAFRFLTSIAVAASLVFVMPSAAPAQQINSAKGQATQLDMLQLARDVSMRDTYNRALYLFIRSNPNVMNDQEFYVNFLIFLMMRSPGFDCNAAFSDEFERRDFFTNAFSKRENKI